MGAGVLGTVGVKTERMIGNHKALGQGYIVLPPFNFCVIELFNFATI
jgi:hypothetical protein